MLLPTDSMLPDLGVVSSDSEAARARLRAVGVDEDSAGIVVAGDGMLSDSDDSSKTVACDCDGDDDLGRSGTTARPSRAGGSMFEVAFVSGPAGMPAGLSIEASSSEPHILLAKKLWRLL